MDKQQGAHMQKTVTLFMEAGRTVRRRIDAADIPLTFAQYEALRHVTAHNCLSMQELASTLGIAAPSATGLVQELARLRYLKRTGNAQDRRQVLLVATAAGKRAMVQTLKRRAGVLRAVLRGLSARDHRDLQRIFTIMLAPDKK